MKIFFEENKTAFRAVILFILYSIYDLFQYSVNPVGVDAGYFLSISRDWVNLYRIPGIDTFSGYTTLGYMFYAIPYLLYKTPTFFDFLFLNLILFAFSFYLYYKIVTGLIKNESIIFLILFSFIYNFHNITTDIKLENLILFLNTISAYGLYILSTLHKQSKFDWKIIVVALLLGLSAATTFLIKQYGGLSIIFILFYFGHLKISKWQKITTITICSFFVFIAFYMLTQFILGLNLNNILTQIKGTLEFSCAGSVYGEKKLINLLKGLKYYKFDLVCIFGVFYGFYSSFVTRTSFNQKISEVSKLCLLIIVTQIPFYFQVFPHYKFFGSTFILLYSILIISKLETPKISKFSLIINTLIFVQLLLSIYSIFSWCKGYQEKYYQKLEQHKFESMINKKLPVGAKVFMLNKRDLWFINSYTTPFPKTLSYGFVGLDCIEKALSIEKPKSFWLAGSENIDFKIQHDNYQKTDSIKIKYMEHEFKSIKYNFK